MRIDLQKINKDFFNIKEGIVNGGEVYLITPHDITSKWTKETLNLRSLMVDKNGFIVSHSFKKFFNAGEKPNLYPNPDNFKDWILEDKIDGSLAICDWIFDKFNCRTRGTLSYKTLENAADFDHCFEKYPAIIDVCRANPDDTQLFEITTPNNQIVLNYGDKPDLTYLGFIHKPTGI